jgi:hypothetical protein
VKLHLRYNNVERVSSSVTSRLQSYEDFVFITLQIFMPFPCHAVSLKVHIVSFPHDLHRATVLNSHMPCRAQTMPLRKRLLKATAQHGMGAARHVRINIGRLWTATCLVSASAGYHADIYEGCYPECYCLL